MNTSTIKSSKPLASQAKTQKIIKEIDSALAENKLQAAEDLVHKLRTLDPSPSTSIKLAHLMFIQKKYLQAEQIYKELLPTVTEELKAEVLFGLGQIYFELKAYSDCHLAFSSVSNSYPSYKNIGLVHLKLAKILLVSEEYSGAACFLENVLKNKNNGVTLEGESLVWLSYIKEKQGEKKESLELARKALTIVKNFRTVSCMAFKMIEIKPELAEKICQKVLSSDRDEADWSDFVFLRALASIKLRDYQKAKIMIEEQSKAYPLNYLYKEMLGVVYLKLEEKVKALEVFQSLRVSHPFDLCNMKNLAFAYKSCGYKEEAWHVLEIANSIEGTQTELRDLELQDPKMTILSFPTNNLD